MSAARPRAGGAPIVAEGFGWWPQDRDRPAPDGVDLEIAAGERVLLLGASGSGKSTLLHALAGVLPPIEDGDDDDGAARGARGRLLVGGRDAWERATITGLMQQDPESSILLARAGDDTAFGLENLAVPPEEIWPRVDQATAAVGLEIGRDHDTSALSGGQQQRLGLAGIAVLRPQVLLLDEPTANLDPEGVRTVRAAVEAVLEDTGATLVVVEHRTAVWADLVDRVVVLGPGGVVVQGSPQEVLDPAGPHRAELEGIGIWLPEPARPSTPAPADPIPLAPAEGDDRSTEVLLRARGLEVSREQASSRMLGRRRRRVRAGRPVPEGARAGRPAAAPVDLDLCRGSAVALVGPNGAGKSTLALTLAGLLVPSAGELEVLPVLAGEAGGDPSAWTGPELVSRVGVVFQEPEHQFLASTVRAELAAGPLRAGVEAEEVERRVQRLLERLRLAPLAEANPFTLSGGEKRRLSVGTVLAAAPEVLILDEPTFGQDAITWRAVVELLAEQVREGRCVVVVTHDAELVAALDAQEVRLEPAGREPARHEASAARPAQAPHGLLARRNALIKLLCAVVLTLPLLVSADPITSGLILAGELAALSLAGQRPGTILLRAWPLLAAALLSGWATALLSEAGGRMLVELGPVSLTTGAAAAGAAIALRGLAMALPGLMLLLSTDPTDLADGLARTARLPVRFVLASLVGMRLISVLIDQWQVLVTARRARGAGGSRRPDLVVREWAGRAFGLLVQALRRAARLAVTLEVRGFGGVTAASERTWARPQRVGRADGALLLCTLLLGGGAILASQALGLHRFIWQ